MSAAAVAPAADAAPRFLVVEINAVHESKTNPRRHFDEAALKDLTESIREKGIIVPLLVRPRGGNGAFEIVAGARRYRAARSAGLSVVPVLVRELDDKETLEVQVIENLQRTDVHPLEEAEGYQRLLARHGYTIDTLASRLGKSASYVYQRLKLASLIEPAKKSFLEDKLTAGHAILIARLQPKQQAEALKECFGWDGTVMSVRGLSRWIDNNVHLDLHGAPWKKDDAKLLPIAGACTTCPKRTGFAPALFPDIAKKDTCTDPQCYQAKRTAHLEARIAELRMVHAKLVEVSEDYTPRHGRKGVLGRNAYKEAKKGSCKTAQAAVVVDGQQLGRLIYICANSNCKTHRESWERHTTPRATAIARGVEAANRRKQAAKLLGRQRAFDAIVAKAPRELGPWDLQFLGRTLVDEMHHDSLKRLCDAKGWKPSRTSWGGLAYGARVEVEIKRLNGPQLVRLLYELALAPDLEGNLYSTGGDRLRAAGAHFRVNVKAIERRAAAEIAKKAKAAKKKAKPPAKKKGGRK
ncbi:MAG TPA: ParB/RepB/Spo0J family partition protein [Gemmatimonadales bacterium]|nr:ParB/RepB/Spo0J family partition protein [Gemmatimonadales bacterium]